MDFDFVIMLLALVVDTQLLPEVMSTEKLALVVDTQLLAEVV